MESPYVLPGELLSDRLFEASETLTWMIQRSITTDCNALGSNIARALFGLTSFVREVREARSDLDGVSRELHSLEGVLDLLQEDAGLFPPELAGQTPAVIGHCSSVVDELNASLWAFDSSELSKQEKRTRWLETGRWETARFRTSLEAHKSVLGLALDLVGATTIREVTSDVEPNKRNTIQRRQNSTDTVEDVTRILAEMGQLRIRLPREFQKDESKFTLHDYMSALKIYAEWTVSKKEDEHVAEIRREQSRGESELGAFVGENELFGAYVGDTPDSAIDIDIELVSKTLKDALARSSDEGVPNMDEVINNGMDNIPSRAPTPPPKDQKRLEAARNNMVSPFDDLSSSPPTNRYGVVTQISSGARMNGPPPSVHKSRGFGRFFSNPLKKTISENRPQTRSTMTNSTKGSVSSDVRPSTPVIQASLVRRGSHRLSVSFKKLPMWNAELLEEMEGPDTNAVFGVSLQRSIQIAKGSSKTHHSGNGGSSRREFPLCMQKCCFFLKHEGVEAPDIFAERGDPYRVSKLKELFGRGPKYGEDVDWNAFGVYDAADLILLFLSQLPRPLITEAIAKRWISLSRQAMVSGSHGNRLDQCIDFWEEALGGLKGASRSLLKLLLNLWADIAEAADKNDMTAERLAGVVLKPLMHISSEKYETDFMLALAFLIRKRTEYTELLKKDQSNKKEQKNQSNMRRISKVTAGAW
ncbi:Uu.00g021450.m01.CDS01 [Anthostomella pinea]|uniref:Uu.00g021450.m01.CDS01 n=1 Tax=Anthostomella pinea TaxID=933095 RepID=A0AAI8VZN8_9PEZI|nr:Uu.00g021450.m01.CDS01 [Anthostomella pinea]